MRQRADDGDRLLVSGNDGAAFEQQLEAGDAVGRPVGKIEQGALLDLAGLAETLAQEYGRRRAAIGHRFDIHGNMIPTPTPTSKLKMQLYMATIRTCQTEEWGDISRFTSRKAGSSA